MGNIIPAAISGKGQDPNPRPEPFKVESSKEKRTFSGSAAKAPDQQSKNKAARSAETITIRGERLLR